MRKTCLLLGGLALLALSADTALALTGDEYESLPEASRMMYIVGTLDGWGTITATIRSWYDRAPITVTALDRAYGATARCAERSFTREQALDIVDKYMKAHPTSGNMGAHVWTAMKAACK